MHRRYAFRALTPALVGGAVAGLAGSVATDLLSILGGPCSGRILIGAAGAAVVQVCLAFVVVNASGLTGLPSLSRATYAIWAVMLAVSSGAMVGAGVLFAAYLLPSLGNPCSGGILLGAAAVAAVHVCLAFIATNVLGRAAD